MAEAPINTTGTSPASPILSEPYRVIDSPGSLNTGQAPNPGATGTIQADLTRQYASGAPNQWYMNLVRVLPFSIDDLTADFGADLYQRMLFDPIVNAATVSLKAAVLEDGLTLRPAITDSKDPLYNLSSQFLTESEAMLDDYPGHLDDWLWEMGDGMWRGNTASEITYRLDTTLSGRTQLFIDRLASKPIGSYGYAVDTFRKIVGIMALIPGIGMPVYSGNVIIDPGKQQNMLPRDKFVLYAHRPRDENPLGTSMLRPCYTPWNLKMQLLPEYGKYLRQFGTPSLIGTSPPEAMTLTLTDSNGVPLQGANGPLTTAKSPEQQLLDTLVNVQNGSVGVFPNGTVVTPIEMRGQGNPLMVAFRWLDEQIVTGIKGQTMTSMTQAHGTQALGTVQRNTLDTLVRQIKAAIARVILRDLLRKWVTYNYGARYARLAPRPELGRTEAQDLAADLTAFSTVGYLLDPSQFQEVDERLGMPVRSANWQQEQLRLLEETSKAEAAGKPPAAPPATTRPSQPSQSAPGRPTSKQPSPPPEERAVQARQILSDARWKDAVHLNSQLKARTGISILDPDATPPSFDEAKDAEPVLEAMYANQ